jgi:hypothetical protein
LRAPRADADTTTEKMTPAAAECSVRCANSYSSSPQLHISRWPCYLRAMGETKMPSLPRRELAPGTSCLPNSRPREGEPASSQVVGRAASRHARFGGLTRMEHGCAHDHCGMVVAGGAGWSYVPLQLYCSFG